MNLLQAYMALALFVFLLFYSVSKNYRMSNQARQQLFDNYRFFYCFAIGLLWLPILLIYGASKIYKSLPLN